MFTNDTAVTFQEKALNDVMEIVVTELNKLLEDLKLILTEKIYLLAIIIY